MELTVLPDQENLFETTADIIERFIDAAPAVTLGLSGGSGPPFVHAVLARRSIPWDRVTTWMSDERWVPPDHEASNQKMVNETLVKATGVRFLAPDTTLSDPHVAALRFDTLVGDAGIGGQTPSLIMLGMGADGHTASLFPGTDALAERERLFVANWVEQHDTWRLTATYRLISTADLILIVVAGQGKAEMLSEISKGRDVPVAHITCRGHVRWILDEEAASEL
jgi:6-phosphogluconolactonase